MARQTGADLRFSSGVVKVTQLERNDSGVLTPVVIYEKPAGKNKRKSSFWLSPLEQATRRLAAAESAFGSTYLGEHKKSNAKKRDGWIQDFVPNVLEASREYARALRLNRLLFP